MTTQGQPNGVPVRMYTPDSRITIAAPMPGLEPHDIAVSVADAHVTIRGQERGPRQHERDRLLAEVSDRTRVFSRSVDLELIGAKTTRQA